MELPHILKSDDPWPRTHNALVDYYQFYFREAVRRGDIEPYVWPYRSFGVFVLVAYLLSPPTNSRLVHYAFYPVVAFFFWWTLRAMLETKSGSLVATYGMGIVNAWGILWVASRMIFSDFRNARRVERRHRTNQTEQEPVREVIASTTARGSVEIHNRYINGSTDNRNFAIAKNQSGEYFWQTLPARFIDRLDFILDLFFAMRGPGWEHQARSIPGPPESIASQLNPPPPSTKSVVKEYADKKSLLWSNGIRFVRHQISLDIIKTIMTHDPYFLGFVGSPPPAPYFFPAFVRQSPVLTRWYRLILSMLATRTALGMIFALSPLFFVGILGSRIMGLRAEPWYYSDFNGSWHYLLSDGIGGWWGAWWHQIFRLGFEAPSKWTLKKLGVSSRSLPGKLAGVFTAFTCSGLIHAFASITMLPETKPWSGPMTFFLLQAVGIVIETTVSQAFRKAGITQKIPRLGKNVITIVWIAAWAYYTGPLLVEDFARGGVWLFEPAPFSFCKMLGFGEPNDHWWRWRGRNLFWYSGDRWWKSGIAV